MSSELLIEFIIEGSTENKSFSAFWVDLKTVFGTYPGSKIDRLGAKSQNHQKLSQIRIEGSIVNKSGSAILALKYFLDNDPSPMKALFSPYYDIKSTQLNLNSTSIKFQLNLIFTSISISTSTSLQAHPLFWLQLNLNQNWILLYLHFQRLHFCVKLNFSA